MKPGEHRDEPPPLEWTQNDTPVSAAFADPYFSREDGRAEARDVFIRGNGLPDRWLGRSTFTIAELGFGTGLNFLETWKVWSMGGLTGCRLDFVSFERWPLASCQIARAIRCWPDLLPLCDALLRNWHLSPGPNRIIDDGDVSLTVIVGDARTELLHWVGRADAWYLDGFSPASNPELWEASLMREVFNHSAPGGTFSTYTAAGWVRRNLMDAGFEVRKVAGHGRKRERLQGRRPQ